MRICPTKEEFQSHARTFSVISVWQDFHAHLDPPVSAYLKISARFPDDHFLLESVEGGEKWARYSFIGFDPYLRVRADGNRVAIRKGEVESVRALDGGPLKELAGGPSRVPGPHGRGRPPGCGGGG